MDEVVETVEVDADEVDVDDEVDVEMGEVDVDGVDVDVKVDTDVKVDAGEVREVAVREEVEGIEADGAD